MFDLHWNLIKPGPQRPKVVKLSKAGGSVNQCWTCVQLCSREMICSLIIINWTAVPVLHLTVCQWLTDRQAQAKEALKKAIATWHGLCRCHKGPSFECSHLCLGLATSTLRPFLRSLKTRKNWSKQQPGCKKLTEAALKIACTQATVAFRNDHDLHQTKDTETPLKPDDQYRRGSLNVSGSVLRRGQFPKNHNLAVP